MSRQRDTVSAKYSAKHESRLLALNGQACELTDQHTKYSAKHESGLLALHGQACELTDQHTKYSAKHDCGLLALHGQACELTDQHIKSAKIPRRSLLVYDTVTDKQLQASKKLLPPFSGQMEARRSLRPTVMPSTRLVSRKSAKLVALSTNYIEQPSLRCRVPASQVTCRLV
jgi:hypothetical protein